MIPATGSNHLARHSRTPNFGSSLHSELIRLRYQRPTWVLISFVFLLLGLVMFFFTADAKVGADLSVSPLRGIDQMLPALQFLFAAGAGVVLLTSGSRLVATEYTLGTIRVILGRGTSRYDLVLTKLVACLLLGAGLLLSYVVLCAGGLALVTLHLTGSVGALSRISPPGWHQLGSAVLSAALSVMSCSVVGVTIGAVTRSLTSGMVLSVLFFPLDNALALVMKALHHLDHLAVWRILSAFLLGPTLNSLPTRLTGQSLPSSTVLPTPILHFSAWGEAAVITGWCLVLVALALLSSVRRDVVS
ncbi:MAG: ABC transporter permease subunit [Candidatus Dormiibacterota bacterium]